MKLLSVAFALTLSTVAACTKAHKSSSNTTASESTPSAATDPVGEYFAENETSPRVRITKNNQDQLIFTDLQSGTEIVGTKGFSNFDFSMSQFDECDNPGCSVVTFVSADLSNLQNEERIWTINLSIHRDFQHPETDQDPSGLVISHLMLTRRDK